MAKIKDTDEAWDSRQLGADEAYVAVADASHAEALDEALGMQSISIRLPKQLINHYKLIAQYHGVGYQPLMRDILSRFVPGAMKEIMETEQKKAIQAAERSALPVDLGEVDPPPLLKHAA